MTDDSLGIRMQAQLLMERKLILHQEQQAMREKIKLQKAEENKLKANIARRHSKQSISLLNMNNIPDIPCSESTMDGMYDVVKKERTQTMIILDELQNLNRDIDKELDKEILPNYKIKQSFASYTSYNDQMLAMIRRQKVQTNSSTLHPLLPQRRSYVDKQTLLQIIHTIQNMPKPKCNFIKNEETKNIINELPKSFGEILHLNEKNKHLQVCVDVNYEQKQNKKRNSLDLNLNQSVETVPLPDDLDDLSIDSEQNNIENPTKLIHVEKNTKNAKFDLTSYKFTSYFDSALSDNQSSDDLIRNDDDDNHILHSLLSLNDLLSEIAFANVPSIEKHFDLLLRIVSSLPMGMHYQREHILASMLKKMSKLANPCNIMQRLLFLYWSQNNDKSGNFEDCDFYLYNDFGCMIIYFLSCIVDLQNAANAKTKHNDFIVESCKAWKRMLAHIKLNTKYENMTKAAIPSQILISSVNRCNLQNYKNLSHFLLDGIVYEKIYQYESCNNVWDIFAIGLHSNNHIPNNKMKIKCPLLLRIGMDCTSSQAISHVFDFINCIWSSHKNVNDNGIKNKILYLECHCVAKHVAIWCLQWNLIQIHSVHSMNYLLCNVTDIQSFAHHFIVSSAAIFVCGYLLALNWNEVSQTCFVHPRFGDVYQMNPVSILCDVEKPKFSLDEVLKNAVDGGGENVYLMHIHKMLKSLQKSYDHVMEMDKDKKKENNLWNIWQMHAKRLFHIILFNLNQQQIDKQQKRYFDHSNFHQIAQLVQMLFGKEMKMNGVAHAAHFGEILHAEINLKLK